MTTADVRAISNHRLDRLSAYILDIQTRLGLSEWTTHLKIDRRPDMEDAIAQVKPTKNRLDAALMFSEDFFDMPANEQRHAVVHELAHLPTNGLIDAVWESGLKDVLGTSAFTIFAGVLNVAEERAVDRFAAMLAEFMPLPDLDRQETNDGEGHEAQDSALPESEERADEASRKVESEDRSVRAEAIDSGSIERPVQEGGRSSDARAEEVDRGAEGEGHVDGVRAEDSARGGIGEGGEVSF